MIKIEQKKMKEIISEVEKEFPNDPALQQVHISRRIISLLAKREGHPGPFPSRTALKA